MLKRNWAGRHSRIGGEYYRDHQRIPDVTSYVRFPPIADVRFRPIAEVTTQPRDHSARVLLFRKMMSTSWMNSRERPTLAAFRHHAWPRSGFSRSQSTAP